MSNWQPVMKSAISEVLETMFFVLIEFESQHHQGMPYFCGSRIQLHKGDHSEEITFRVTEPFVRMMTANFLGKDEGEVDQDEMEDVAKELANMVGGNYMSRIDDGGWRLGIPELYHAKIPLTEGPPSLSLPLAYLGEAVGTVELHADSAAS